MWLKTQIHSHKWNLSEESIYLVEIEIYLHDNSVWSHSMSEMFYTLNFQKKNLSGESLKEYFKISDEFPFCSEERGSI